MRMVYYFKNTRMIIEQTGEFNKEEWDTLLNKMTINSPSVYIEFESSVGKYEGSLPEFNDWVNGIWLKNLGIGSN